MTTPREVILVLLVLPAVVLVIMVSTEALQALLVSAEAKLLVSVKVPLALVVSAEDQLLVTAEGQLLVNYHPYGVHEGVFKHTSVKGNALVTKNMVPVESVYNEKCISVQNVDGTRVEYRVWNPFRSKLGAAILAGIDYYWDFSPRSGRDLVNMAKKRTNVIPIIVDARHPARYWMLVSLVDVIFADVAQPDQARILGLNANCFLKVGGCCLISIKANCIDSTLPAEKVYELEMERMRAEQVEA